MENLLHLTLVLVAVGSGSVRGCGQRCYLSSQEVPEPIWSEEEAIASARCFAGCLQKYASSAVSVVMECSTGCAVRANNTSLTRNECKQQCMDACVETCGTEGTCNDSYTGTSCPRLCQKKACNGGCILYNDVVSTVEANKAPPSPSNPPTLTSSQPNGRENDAGLYLASIPSSSTASDGNSNNVTNFVFKVEIGNTKGYFTQERLEDLLDLGYFACRKGNVSFAAVNAYGRSNFSALSEVCIRGENRFPSQPEQFLYTIVPDLREGYESRAEVNITWKKPIDYEYITHYTISVFSQKEDCGGVRVVHKYDNIHRDATNFILMARNHKDIPGFGCNYQVTLLANPVQPDQDGLAGHIILSEPPTEPLAQSLSLECHKYTNETTGKIALLLNWTLQASPTITKAIDYYHIYVAMVDVGQASDIPQVKQSIWNGNEDANGTNGGYLVHKLEPHDDPGYRYKARVTPVVSDDLEWMQVPDWRECTIDTLPDAPSTIAEVSIAVSDFSISGDGLNFSMSWSPPNVTYGSITSYDVLVTRDPFPPGSDSATSSIATVYSAETPVNSITVTEGQIYITGDKVLCLFAQVRAKNAFLSGGWSMPVTLVRYPTAAPNCTLLPSPMPKEVKEMKQELPLFIIVVSAGLGCVIVATVLVLIVVVYLCRKHRTKKQMEKVFKGQGYQNPMFAAGNRSSRHGSVSYKPSVIESPRADEWELPASSVMVEEELAEGCFGLVHKGIVKGPLPHSRTMKNSICETVAIKFLKRSADGSERTDFLNEIETMKKVANGNNRFVVNLVGCVTIQEPLCLITEFVKHGDLLSYLQSVRKQIDRRNRRRKLAKIAGLTTPEPYLVPQPTEPPQLRTEEDEAAIPEPEDPYADLGELEPVNLISFAYQIACGMEYLASLDVVHRDLACRNILLGDHKALKISDFGLSRLVAGDDVYVKTSKGRLPWKWMAMESTVNREFTAASDIWSYGVTLWEIATLGGFPYPMIPNGELLDYLKKGYRLECPENCSRDVYDIMLECWCESPLERPTFTQLKARFDAMLEEDNPYIHFDTINTHKPYYSSASSGIESDAKTEGLASELESSTPSLGSSVSDSDRSSGAYSGATGSDYDLHKPQNSTQVVEVHLEIEPTDSVEGPTANPYVDTPTKPYDSSFDLDVLTLQQTIEEGVETGMAEYSNGNTCNATLTCRSTCNATPTCRGTCSGALTESTV